MQVSQIFLTDGEEELPDELKARSQTIKNLFVGSNYTLFTNSTLRQFIQDNYPEEVVQAYDKLKPFAYKADLGKFCVVNKLGGWYADIGVHSFLRNMSLELNNVNMIVFGDRRKFAQTTYPVSCGLFYSKKENLVLQMAIQLIVENCKNDYYGFTSLDPTGPNLFGRAIAMTGYNIVSGTHMELTPETELKNCAYVLPNGTILCLSKNKEGGNLSSFGCKGVNNYQQMWAKKDIYN
jgi:hypothetical protein